MAGFTFVGRESQIAGFREFVERPEGELLLVAGEEGSGKSHFLRRLRREVETMGSHFVQFIDLSFLPDAHLRHYAVIAALAGEQVPASEDLPPRVTQLLPNRNEFFEDLMTEDRRPPQEKLLRVFSAVSAHLSESARLVLLLDLGRAIGDDAFPLEFYAHRLPENVKLAFAVSEVPAALEGAGNVSILEGLPPLAEADSVRLLEFHLSQGAIGESLAGKMMERYGGHPMALDLAAKVAATKTNPAGILPGLPKSPSALCAELLGTLSDDERRLVQSIARVPSGVDIASLRALTDFSDVDLGRLLRSNSIRNLLITQRTANGPEAHLCHDLLADTVLAEAPDDTPEGRTFHRQAAAFFLELVQADPTNVIALTAHGYHLRLSGEKQQFLHDFPRTYKAKHSLRLFQQLADEYRLLLQYCDELDETSINRPACLANLGRVFQELGQHDNALCAHQEALTLYERADDAAGTAEQLANIASVLQAQGQRAEAIAQLERAARLDEAAGNQAALAADLNNLGIVCQELGRHDEALAHHQRALALHEELGNDVGCANQLANMAVIHRARGDLATARECYQKAWVIDTRTNNTLAQVVDLCNLGGIFQELGDMEKAVASYQQVIEIDRALADPEAEATHLRALAGMHIRAEAPDEAIQLVQQALEIDRSIGNPRGEADDLLALAKAYRAAGDLVDARDLLERAANCFARLGDHDAEREARKTLEKVDRRMRGEAVDEPQDEARKRQTTIIQREPAGEQLWGNLELVDDDGGRPPAEPEAASPPAGAAAQPAGSSLAEIASEVGGQVRRERDEAVRRVAELEAELQNYKGLVHSLQKIVGEADSK